MSHRPMSSSDLSSLIAETEALMGQFNAASTGTTPAPPTNNNNATGSGASTTNTTITHTVRSPTKLMTSASSTTVTRSYEEHKARVASSAHAAALRALSPRAHTSRSRVSSPQPLSPSKLFSRPSTVGAGPQPSPLSPREQARREINRNGMKSPRITSPGKYEGGAFASGPSFSGMRASSASPSRFRAVADAARAAEHDMAASLRFENLLTPAPVTSAAAAAASTRQPIRSPQRTPTRFTASRPSTLDASAIRNSAYVHAPLEPWRELNRQLSLHGFSMVHPFPVPSGTNTELPWSPNSTRLFRGVTEQAPSAALNTLLTNFTSLLAEYGRRGQTIQELMNKSLAENSSHAHCHAELTALRRVNAQQSARINDLHRSLETSSVDRVSSLKNLTHQIEHSQQQFHNLETKFQHNLRDLQHRTDEVGELRRKLEEQRSNYERHLREDSERTHLLQREKELQLTQTQLRMRELEQQLQECQHALLAVQTTKREDDEASRQREKHLNYVADLAAKEAQEKIHSLQITFETERAASRARVREIEADWSTRVLRVEEQLVVTSTQVAETQSTNNNLRTDLITSQAQLRALEEQVTHLQHDKRLQSELITELELKSSGLQAAAIHGYNLQELNKYLNSFQSTTQLLKREQLGTSFDVAHIHGLPKEILGELVLLVCMKLKTTDATSIGQNLDQLISVASAVPGMQEFIGQIWGVVTGTNSVDTNELTPENLITLTTSILPTLRQWQSSHEQTVGLQRFRLDILDGLRRRVHRSPLNPLHSASGAGSAFASSVKLHDDLPNEEIIFELNDIVSNENRLNALVYDQHASPSSFFQLWAQMDKTPLTTQPHSQDSDKIVAHIQQLFDIPHKIGMFPKMNELFLFVNETRPAIQAMRSLLRLDSRATIHTCIKALKRLVDGAGIGGLNESLGGSRSFSPDRSIRHENNGRGLAWTVTSPSKTEHGFISSAQSMSSAPSKDQMQRNAQYWAICKQLKAALGVKKMSDIIGAVNALSAKAQPDYLTASIMTQLVSMLEVSNMTELPSAVSWLREQHAMLQRRIDSDDRSSHTNKVAQELSHQLAAKRDEFIANLKQIVGVSPSESDATLVDTLTKLTRDAAAAATRYQAPPPPPPQPQPLQTPQQKEQQLIITQLRGYLDVRSTSEIVSTVRTLINKIHSYDEILPKLDSIISRLYELLHINTLDDVVPAVRKLVVASSNAAAAAVGRASGPLAHSSSALGSLPRGLHDSAENSPTLSAISDVTTGSNHSATARTKASMAGESPLTTTTTRTTTSHVSSLYISGKSPYRSVNPGSASGPSSRSAFDRDSVDLSSYAPGADPDSDADQRAVEEEIDRTLGQHR